MGTTGQVQDMQEERRKQKQNALKKLEELSVNKIELKRPVFFVPGWTDESCRCWAASYKKNISIKDWLDRICKNPQEVSFVNFENESPRCNNFLDFGEVLKKKVWDIIGKNKEFDIIGHSMGGLDIRAAVALGEPLLNVHNCITVATPHQGDHLGGVNVWTRNSRLGRFLVGWALHKDTPYHREQSKGLDPDYEPIKTINKVENKKAFLEQADKLYQFKGTRDFTVKGSAYINRDGLDPDFCKKKIENVEIGGADHTGIIGITQDPRTILAIINIILGIELEKPKYNYGIFVGGIQIYNNSNLG